MAAKKKSPETTARVFSERPSKAELVTEIERFFALLREGDVEAAGEAVAHAGTDWWPHQVRALWQDLAVPWLEEQGEDADLDDDRSWRDFSWLEKIGVDVDTDWDAADDTFFVNVVYDGEVTDVSADFRVAKRDGGWVLEREIIHVA
jgi:hypothetical protein